MSQGQLTAVLDVVATAKASVHDQLQQPGSGSLRTPDMQWTIITTSIIIFTASSIAAAAAAETCTYSIELRDSIAP